MSESGSSKSKIGAALSVGGLFLLKFKSFFGLLKGALVFGKFFSTFASMFVMIAVYAWFYGWKWAVGFVVLLLIHEMGHLIAARREGLNTSLPLFIPFVGALISMKEPPKDARTESIVALGGPLLGTAGAFLFLFWAQATNSLLLYSLAYIGFFLTVFNMIPASPLDGGRIVTAITPYMWLIGIPIILFFAFSFFNPMMILIALMSIITAWQAWKDRDNPYYKTDMSFKCKMSFAYFSLFAVAGYYSYSIHTILKANEFMLR